MVYELDELATGRLSVEVAAVVAEQEGQASVPVEAGEDSGGSGVGGLVAGSLVALGVGTPAEG